MGEKGQAYQRCFRTSRSTGTMLARMLRCVIRTPFGSAVAPEVNRIWQMSSGRAGRVLEVARGVPIERRELEHGRAAGSASRRQLHLFSDEDRLGRGDADDALEEIGRVALVDGRDGDAAQHAAPESGHPGGAVFAPQDHAVAGADAMVAQLRRAVAGAAGEGRIGVAARAKAIVIDEVFAAQLGNRSEVVEQRCADHAWCVAAGLVEPPAGHADSTGSCWSLPRRCRRGSRCG